jgi:hypothetical protein
MPNQIAWMETGIAALRGTRPAEGEKLSVMFLLIGLVKQRAGLEADLFTRAEAAGSTVAETMSAYHRLLSQLIDAGTYPAMSEVIAAGALGEFESADSDAEFLFGIDRTLDGIGALMKARSQFA